MNCKGFDNFDCIVYELNNEKGLIKEYDFNHKLIFDGEYLMERKMEKEKNMMMVN